MLFGVHLVLGDAGGGALANSYLTTALGSRAHQVQYEQTIGKQTKKPALYYNGRDRYMAARTKMIDHFFAQLKNGCMRFGNAEQMEPVFDDMLSLYEDESKTGQRVWRKAAGTPDDALHAQVFGWIAGNIVLGNLTFADDVT